MVKSEVWNKVVDWVALWSLEGGSEFVLELRLGILGVLLGGENIMIETKVRNEVVSWWWLSSFERSNHLVIVDFFGFVQV
jgi:hypothetical protein